MTQLKDHSPIDIYLSSTVFPTPEDKALWQSLTDAQRRAHIEQQEQAAFESGVSEKTDLQVLLNEARSD